MLYKFCNPSHNINKGAQIRLGALYEYSSTEND